MSTNAVELALWTITTRTEEAERFKRDRSSFLLGFRLTADEYRAVVDEDMRGLIERNVNDMLVFAFFQLLYGRKQIPRYLELLKAP